MGNSYNIQKNDQLFVNNKWYFDVMDVEGDSVKVRIKYYEAPSKNFYHYRTIKLPKTYFQNCVQDNFIVRCQIHEPQLKLQIGGLINRIAIETDVLALAESINQIKENFTDSIFNPYKIGDIILRQGLKTDPFQYLLITRLPNEKDYRFWGRPVAIKEKDVLRIRDDKREIDFIATDIIGRAPKNEIAYIKQQINEDVASAGSGSGMGAVVNPGLSGTPGEIGSMGSGDLSTPIKYGSTKLGIVPKQEFGLQIQSKSNMKHHRKSAKKQKGTLIRKPIMTIGESLDPEIKVTNSDHEYKTSVYTFLDYPTDNENDLQLIGCVAEYRPDILEISAERLIQYFRDLYKTNKALIKNKCSEWFQNQMLVLAQLSE